MLELKIHVDAKDEMTRLIGEDIFEIGEQLAEIIEGGQSFGIAEYILPFDKVSATVFEIADFVFGAWKAGDYFSILYERRNRVASWAEILEIVSKFATETGEC